MAASTPNASRRLRTTRWRNRAFCPRAARRFYAVGGAWRALGRIDIALRDHPIHVLHHHEMSRANALRVADFIRKQSKRSLERLEDAAAKRADALPYAAVILERVLKTRRVCAGDPVFVRPARGLAVRAFIAALARVASADRRRRGVWRAERTGAGVWRSAGEVGSGRSFPNSRRRSAKSAITSCGRRRRGWRIWAARCIPISAANLCTTWCCARRSPPLAMPSARFWRRRCITVTPRARRPRRPIRNC